MMQATQTAASGMRAQQTRLDTIAANVANVSTIGYKSARADFKDALYTKIKDPVGDSDANNLLRGTGVVLSATGRDFSDGSPQTTGAELDFSISGDGFFMLENGAGERLYTRNGNFAVSVENGGNYLVNADGDYVLSDQGQRIKIPNTGGISVTADGTLSSGGTEVAKLGIADFDNAEGLSAAGDSCFRETAASGTAYAAQNAQVAQGSLESSNVDLGEEMTLLMRAQRVYSLSSKALQTADEMDGLANNMR
jgi:flagellar basal-body rod protein FlgG